MGEIEPWKERAVSGANEHFFLRFRFPRPDFLSGDEPEQPNIPKGN